jgi:hypothetical protein
LEKTWFLTEEGDGDSNYPWHSIFPGDWRGVYKVARTNPQLWFEAPTEGTQKSL